MELVLGCAVFAEVLLIMYYAHRSDRDLAREDSQQYARESL